MARPKYFPDDFHSIKVAVADQEGDGIDSKIEEVADDNTISFSLSNPFDQVLGLQVGDRVAVYYVRQDASYTLYGEITDVLNRGNRTRYRMSPEENIERVQRRQFVRAAVTLPVKFTAVKVPDGFGQTKSEAENVCRQLIEDNTTLSDVATAVDLSGGGMAVQTKVPLRKQGVYLFSFSVDETLIKVVGEVKMSGLRPGDSQFRSGVQFIGLSRRDQDLIIQFVFKESKKGVSS